MPIKMDLVRQTIPEAEKDESSSLFVLNKSDPRGNINFVVKDVSGHNVSIQIPITFIPVDLSTFSVKSDVLRTPDFRRLVAKGWIHIIESGSAEKVLEDPKAKAEFNRINNVLEEDNDIANFQTPVTETVNAEPPAPKEEDSVGTFAQNIILRAASEPVEGLINELEGKLDTLSEGDINYMKENTASDAIKEWCDEALEVLAGA